MNKPEWKDAPYWARYMAQDFDGEWYWYQYPPDLDDYIWYSDVGKTQFAYTKMKLKNPEWLDTMEERP